jgi:hypothetical protein
VAAIVYFEKILEDDEGLTYRYGPNVDNLSHSFTISKAAMRPTDDPEEATFNARLAFRGIMQGYRTQGKWPECGAGYT